MDRLCPNPALIDEILERILDRGMVLDGLSSLAAVSSKRKEPIRATAYCSIEDEPALSTAVLFPPRKRDRD